MTTKDGKKNFLLLDEDGNVIAKYKNRHPRQAALKAANTGVTNIRLLQRGTKNKEKGGWKIHKFVGERSRIPKPTGSPNWMPDMVFKPNVTKVGIERLMITLTE
jgi:hypothetical protein